MRRAVIAAAATLAVLGGSLAGAAAANADALEPAACLPTTSILSDVVPAGPVVGCAPTAPTAPTTDQDSAAAAASTSAADPSAATPATYTAQSGPATESAARSQQLSTVRVVTNTSTVYPAATGYAKSTVRFSIRGLTAAQTGVRITGTAVLRKGSHVVRAWSIDDMTTTLTWDGKYGAKVVPGRYVLTATAWSSDGSAATSIMRVRVSAKHLVTQTVRMRTRDLTNARTDTLPVAVMRGFQYGNVTFRVHTVAEVSGPARLLIRGPYGEQFSIPLRDGTHATRSAVLPSEFTSASFRHLWKKGDARLIELYTVFTYKRLV